jgi:hypothetical protein
MKAVVVYESLWGNTAAIARAIAEGLGPEARALTTSEASAAAIAGAELIVAGAPVLGFQLPTDKMRSDIGVNPGKAPTPPDLSHPSMRSWLDALPAGTGRSASFETRVWWSPGGATGAINESLEHKGYLPVTKGRGSSSRVGTDRCATARSSGPARGGTELATATRDCAA